MNLNTAIQSQGIIAWAGATGNPVDIRKHTSFSFTFQVTADLVADAEFFVRAAPASDLDPCVPGAFVAVPEVISCASNWGARGEVESKIILPAGAVKGSICTATLPCKPDAFVRLVSAAGPTTNVIAVVVLTGPR